MDPRNLSVLLALLVALSVVPAAMAADFEISASDTTPMPERTVDVQGQSFTVDSMVRVSPGATVTADVTGPDDNYQVNIYDKDRNIKDFANAEGDDSVSFDISGYEPGSYVIATFYDGEATAIQPLLVSGYDVAVDAPDSVGSDGSAEVTVDVTETAASSDPANVQVVVAQGDTAEEFDATGGDGEYTATVDGGALDEGDYTVYAVAQGDEEAFGRSELLGLSDGHSLTVESGSNGDGGSGSDGTDGSESTEETETTTNESGSDGSSDGGDSTDESTDGGDGAANPPANETTETETTTAPPTTTVATTESPTETDDGVVTPANETTVTETETGATSLVGPGFTVAGALVAVALVALLGRRRP